MDKCIAIYPGTFDPFHNGHLDIVRRAARLFDKVIIVISNNSAKKERRWPAVLMEEAIAETIDAEIDAYPEMNKVFVLLSRGMTTAEFAATHDACAIIRGIRTASDLDYENAVCQGNKMLYPGNADNLEHVYLLSNGNMTYLSSSFVREMVRPDIPRQILNKMVPRPVYDLIIKEEYGTKSILKVDSK